MSDRKNLDELLVERAERLEELKALNSAIKLLSSGSLVFRIGTRKNLRNSRLAGIPVFEDEGLTKVAPISDARGYISSASLAHLRLNVEDEEGEMWWIEEG